MSRRLSLVLLVAVAALALVPSAGAGVRLRAIDTSGFPLIRATLVAPAGATTPVLRENGLPVVGYQAANLGQQKALLLAIDRSESMTGRPLAAAIAAAQSLVADAHSSDDVGVVAFGRDAIALTPAAATPADAAAALRGLSVDTVSGTALYDAIVLAAGRLAGDARPGRAIVVVTDGQDVSSTHTLTDAVAAARAAHAAVFTIGIRGPGFTPDVLRRLARDTGGSYREAASVADLKGLYASLAGELDRTWELSYVTALRPGATLDLAAAVPGAGTSTAQTQLAADGSAPAAPSNLIPAVGYTTAGTVLVAIFAGLLVLLACLFWFASDRASRLRARIEPHVSQVPAARARSRRDRNAARRKVADGLEHALGDLRSFKGLQLKLDRADLPLRAGEVVALCVAFGLVAGLLAAAGGASGLIDLCVLALAGSLPIVYVSFRAGGRVRRFDDQLPDILITISASLKAGHSFRQGVQSVVEEGADPAAKEFRRVLTETQLGKPMDDALGDLALRIGSKNLTFVINAVTIQRQVGGSLAGLFDMVADTVRQRQQFRRKVKGLTAMGRMSAYVLVALPVFVALIVTAMNPTYMAPLYHSSTGQTMLTAGVVMIAVGSLILKKIVSFRG